jgi:hypothetical protein
LGDSGFFIKKLSPGESRGCVVFMGVLTGVLEKCGAACGFFMVKLWSIRGELWCVDDSFLGAENFPLFS